MKKIRLLAILALLFTSQVTLAQDSKYKVVFDITSKDSVNQQALIRQLGFIRKSNPDSKLEVVIYGQGLDLAIKGKSQQEAAVNQLIADKGVSFKVCAVTMKRYNIDKSQLLPGVEVVDDGIFEIISKQQEGWGYIKVAH
jgi:intracellular sulfur oxidation DsrE/DsrF family protein